MARDLYSRGEVAFLLSLTRDDAIDEDASQADSLSRCTPDGPGSTTSHEEWDPVFTIARWNEVHAAKACIVKTKVELAVLELRVGGHTEQELADHLGIHRLAGRRRFGASLDELLELLGGEALPDDSPAAAEDACLSCALGPRVRLRAKRRRVRGGWKVIRPERQAAVCRDCLREDLQSEVLSK